MPKYDPREGETWKWRGNETCTVIIGALVWEHVIFREGPCSPIWMRRLQEFKAGYEFVSAASEGASP